MPPERGLRRARRPTPCGTGTARARGKYCGRPPRDPGAWSSPFASLPEVAHECRELARRPFSFTAGCNLDARAASGDQNRGLECGGLDQLGERSKQRKVRVAERRDRDHPQRVAVRDVGPGAVAPHEYPTTDPPGAIGAFAGCGRERIGAGPGHDDRVEAERTGEPASLAGSLDRVRSRLSLRRGRERDRTRTTLN